MDIKPTIPRMGPDVSTTQASNNKAQNANAGVKQADTSSGLAADLTLTDAAKNLMDIQASAADMKDVDLARVEALRQAIDDGTYEVDSAKLADNLIQSSLELP